MSAAVQKVREFVRLSLAGDSRAAYATVADMRFVDFVSALQHAADEDPTNRNYILAIEKQVVDYSMRSRK